MDCQHYRNFVVIVDEMSLTAAAKKLHIAQPALSNQLKSLEAEYGARLLERTSRHMELTDAGRILYEKARHISDLETSAKREVRDCVNGLAGTLRLAIPFTSATDILNVLITQFHKDYPLIRYQLYEAESDQIIQLLKNGIVEIGMARSPYQASEEFSYIHGKAQQFVAVYKPEMNRFPHGDTIHLEHLRNLPLCVTRKFEPMITNACMSYGFAPNIMCVNTQLLSSVRWAKLGMGVAVVPGETYRALGDKTLRCKVIDEPQLATTCSIITAKGRYLSAVAAQFLEEFQKASF